jgi:rhodanese-related sulfurtransferase
MLRLICRVSLSPDSCVSSTRAIYAKWGSPSLVLAKFIPGFAAIGTTLAGYQRTPLRRFVAYDGTGALLWAGVAIATGVIFHGAVNEALMTLESMGRVGLGVVLVVIVAFVIRKYWKRRLFLRELRMERISVAELQALMDTPESPLLIDVRSEAERDASGWIPGAVHAARVADLAASATGDVVVYCDCPNEASAALVASQLKRLGFARVRPLAGGLEAWRSHGLPIEAAPDRSRRA